MKIIDIKTHQLKPTVSLKFSSLPELQVPFNLVRVLTGEDIEGHFITNIIRAETMQEVVNFLKPFLIGEDPFDREKIWNKVYELGEYNVGAGMGPVFSALDIALWDIVGKISRVPVYKILGGYRDKIRAYASTLTYKSLREYENLCTRLIEDGFTAIKLHAWGNPKEDIKLCYAIRQTVGSEIDLMLDASFMYDREGALKVGRGLDKLGFNWYEDPLLPSDIEGYVNLAKTLDTSIKAGEGFGNWTRGPSTLLFYEYIKRGAADIIGALGDKIGGITALRKVADLCEIANVRFEPHNYGTTFVQAAHLHVELASKSCCFFELPVPEGILDVGVKDKFRIDSRGFVCSPTKPGLGVELDWAEIEKLTSKVF